jgi:hypothetical protein
MWRRFCHINHQPLNTKHQTQNTKHQCKSNITQDNITASVKTKVIRPHFQLTIDAQKKEQRLMRCSWKWLKRFWL